jgi:23S rRNA pseudouridine2605 synthase
VFRKLPELETGRWISIGRLDINTSGLLLLTNHGELARRLMHPSFEMRRQYAVRVLGVVDDAVIARLIGGVQLDDGPARFESMELADFRGQDDDDVATPTTAANRWYRVTVAEGRNRVVRRLLESQTLQVSRLIRIAYGPIALGSGIKSGSYRELEREEVAELMAAVDLRKDGSPRA